MKKILFLSALDFKDKSIQVIRKTPEAYVKAGFDVHYVVARDNSKLGNYFYESIIDLPSVATYRFNYPLTSLVDRISNHTLRTIISKFAGYAVVLKLAYKGSNILMQNKIDVVYGYEKHGVLAVNILRFFGKLKGKKIVSRFQGTFCYIHFKEHKYLKSILNWDSLLALYLPADLCIMTNDGTQGDQALKMVRSKAYGKLRFWVNGVDNQVLSEDEVLKVANRLGITNETILLTVCRLESWKRVDRGIKAAHILKGKYNYSNFKYYIVGDGALKDSLQALVSELGLNKNIIFTGAVNNACVKEYLNVADFFISTYDSSNVGNPLLEAISANKIIFTLNNGDTGTWIQHYKNGFIYDINDELYDKMANDIYKLVQDDNLKTEILTHISSTKSEKLWSWENRFSSEVTTVSRLLSNGD